MKAEVNTDVLFMKHVTTAMASVLTQYRYYTLVSNEKVPVRKVSNYLINRKC